jgi:hypothetical protein
MTIEQENAINLIQKLIDYNAINGEQATTLMLGVMSNNFNTPLPAVDDIPYKPIKVYYSDKPTIEEVKRNSNINKTNTDNIVEPYYRELVQPTMEEVKRNYITHEITEPLPSYTISTTTGVNEMINKITDKT